MSSFGLAKDNKGAWRDSKLVKFNEHGHAKMNRQLCASICKGLRLGLSLSKSAESCGFDEKTVRRWYLKGEDREPGYREFYTEVNKAKPQALMRNAEVVQAQADKGDFRAAIAMREIVERSMERYSEDAHRQLTDVDKVRLALAHPTLGPIFKRQIIDQLKVDAGEPTEIERKLFKIDAIDAEGVPSED